MARGDQSVLVSLDRLNFRLCKRLLPRDFSEFARDDRFHWAAVFQGSRTMADRHLHVMIHVPAAISWNTPLQRLKVQYALQAEWLRLERLWPRENLPWCKTILDDAASKSVATYVSRQLTVVQWTAEEVHFSQ